MRTLICGSIAYDTIMVFPGRFKEQILPEKLHILNVAFLVPDMRREFGGCAGNIAYSLKLLGGEPLIMATVGDDYQPYQYRLDKLHIKQPHIRTVAGTFTAQAFITTDLDDNQITAFHPGAMSFSHHNRIADTRDVTLGLGYWFDHYDVDDFALSPGALNSPLMPGFLNLMGQWRPYKAHTGFVRLMYAW